MEEQIDDIKYQYSKNIEKTQIIAPLNKIFKEIILLKYPLTLNLNVIKHRCLTNQSF